MNTAAEGSEIISLKSQSTELSEGNTLNLASDTANKTLESQIDLKKGKFIGYTI